MDYQKYKDEVKKIEEMPSESSEFVWKRVAARMNLEQRWHGELAKVFEGHFNKISSDLEK
jgi:uncharacterized protein YukE